MRTFGLDIGRSAVKVFGDGGYEDIFPSVLGEYRELRSERPLGPTDIILHWNGRSWFGGELAARESEYPVQDSRGSKLHEKTKLLAVMAMHRAVNDGDEVLVATGEPIDDHKPDNKERLRRMIEGSYMATLNGVTKSWRVIQCLVTAEDAVAVWGLDTPPQVMHVIGAGSRKTNYAVLTNRGLYDRLSGTFDFGCETVRNMKPGLFADMVAAQLSRRWLKQMGPILITGGMAERLQPEFERHFQSVFTTSNARMDNAKGMYTIGVMMNAKTTAQR